MSWNKSKPFNLFLLIQGNMVSSLGSQIYDIAMLLWIKQLTGSAAVMGLAMLLTNLPEAILAPLGGRAADRWGRVRTIIVSDLVSGLAVGIILAGLLKGASPDVLLVLLCLSNLILGLSAACFVPAVSSLIPDLTSRNGLARANAAHQFSGVGAKVLGQGGGGLLFAWLGPLGAFAVNSASFFLSALSESFIRLPEEKKSEASLSVPSRNLAAETWSTLKDVWKRSDLRRLILYIGAFHFCLSCLPVLLPFYAEKVLGIADKWFGFFVAAYTLGVMLGFLLAGLLGEVRERPRLISLASLSVGGCFILTALVASFWPAWALLVCVGAGIGLIVVNLMTELQTAAPAAQRGGIMGAAHALGGSSLPIGMALTGLLLDGLHRLGMDYGLAARLVLAFSGTAALLLGISSLAGSKTGKRTF